MKKITSPMLMLIAITTSSVLHRIQAQQPRIAKYDSNYIIDYPQKFGVNIFASQKYASFNMPSTGSGPDIEYHANRKYNLGLGGTYKNVLLNLSLGAGYLTDDNKGKTTGLDFHIHFVPYKWQIDLLTSFHKGNYLSPKGYLSVKPQEYHYRPDVKLDLIGGAAYRVANPRKYSPGAALNQTYLQTKSAGSFLYGGEAYYGSLKGDSSLVPPNAFVGGNKKSTNKISFLNVGPGIGYAYTLVLQKNYFISGSVIGNADLNIVTEDEAQGNNSKTNIGFSGVYKGAIGYNSGTWSVAGTVSGILLSSKAVYSSKNYLYNTGIFRISIGRKFNM
ncbi:MAG: DUF4421 family protein [Chitinophagaceae bacterium]